MFLFALEGNKENL